MSPEFRSKYSNTGIYFSVREQLFSSHDSIIAQKKSAKGLFKHIWIKVNAMSVIFNFSGVGCKN